MLPWMSETKESRTVTYGKPSIARTRSWPVTGDQRLTLCPVGLGPAAASGTTLIGTPGMEACRTLPAQRSLDRDARLDVRRMLCRPQRELGSGVQRRGIGGEPGAITLCSLLG